MEDHETLISVESLSAELENPSLQVVDCRFNLLQPDAGRAAYAEAHIPGAAYAHLDDDLAAPITPGSGRHPLPAVDAIAGFFGKIGIDPSIQVVVYDDKSGAIAARAWWLLRWLGHRRVAVLDGGFARWQALRMPTVSGSEAPEPRNFRATPRPELVIGIDEVVATVEGRAELQLVDARDAVRFRGEREPIDSVAGHIPGAINLPCGNNIGENGLWRDARVLHEMWSDALPGGVSTSIGAMCGSGVTACHLVLSSILAGFPEPRVYVGSWSEWIQDPSRPVASGDGGSAPGPAAG